MPPAGVHETAEDHMPAYGGQHPPSVTALTLEQCEPFCAQLCIEAIFIQKHLGDSDTASETSQWLLRVEGRDVPGLQHCCKTSGGSFGANRAQIKQIDTRRGIQGAAELSGSGLTSSSPSTAQCHPVPLPQLVVLALRSEYCFSTCRVLTLHTSGKFMVVI